MFNHTRKRKTYSKANAVTKSFDNPFVWLLLCGSVLGACHYALSTLTAAGL